MTMRLKVMLLMLASISAPTLVCGQPENPQGEVPGFKSHSLQLEDLPASSYSLAGKSIQDAVGPKGFGGWIQIEYEVAKDADAGKVMIFLQYLASTLLSNKENLHFFSYEKLREKAITKEMKIDARILIRYSRDRDHPLFGSKEIILNVDSTSRCAYVKAWSGDGLIGIP